MARRPAVPQDDPRGVADQRRREWGAHTRGGWVILFLWQGSRFTNKEIARLTGMTRRGAQKMVEGMAAHFPIDQDDDGKWFWVAKDDD